jgi:hypothetical protein
MVDEHVADGKIQFRPDPAVAVELFKRHFLNRTDRVAFKPGESEACPAEGNGYLDGLLTSHLTGEPVPLHWITARGNSGNEVGPQRIGTYSPDADGRTVYACADFDGGGRHGKPLKDPLGVALDFYFRCRQLGLPAYLERSGGGEGWHVWLFFDRPVSAALVRKLMFGRLPTNAELRSGGKANARANAGIEVFPKQDAIGKGGVGNLVWLPWWNGSREGANLFHRVTDDGEIEPFLPTGFDTVSESDVQRILLTLDGRSPPR